MKGTRPLTPKEIKLVYAAFGGKCLIRNRALFQLGISCGARISELLALLIGDVYQNGAAVTDLLFEKNIVKGGEVSRAVPLNADGRSAIDALINWHQADYGSIPQQRVLFPSRVGKGDCAMSRQYAHQMLKDAFEKAGLNGKLATHSLRKSYAQRLYTATGDIYCVQEMLGHKSIATTQAYLGVDYQKLRRASDEMVIFSENKQKGIKGVSDDTLLIELARRGFDIGDLVSQKERNQTHAA